eukprot:1001326-Prymnesium_polylepis.3
MSRNLLWYPLKWRPATKKDRLEEAWVEPEGERPPVLDVRVSAKRVLRSGRHGAQELLRLLVVDRTRLDRLQRRAKGLRIRSFSHRRTECGVEACEEVARELGGDGLHVRLKQALARVLSGEERMVEECERQVRQRKRHLRLLQIERAARAASEPKRRVAHPLEPRC